MEELQEIAVETLVEQSTDPMAVDMLVDIRAMLQQINEKYRGHYHFKMFNIISMQDLSCDSCNKDTCLRCVIEYTKGDNAS